MPRLSNIDRILIARSLLRDSILCLDKEKVKLDDIEECSSIIMNANALLLAAKCSIIGIPEPKEGE